MRLLLFVLLFSVTFFISSLYYIDRFEPFRSGLFIENSTAAPISLTLKLCPNLVLEGLVSDSTDFADELRPGDEVFIELRDPCPTRSSDSSNYSSGVIWELSAGFVTQSCMQTLVIDGISLDALFGDRVRIRIFDIDGDLFPELVQ